MAIAQENDGPGREYVTQERLLFDTVERLAKDPWEWVALHIYLSKLLPYNRTEARLRVAFRLFDPLVSSYRSQVFVLSNQDFVILGKGMRFFDAEEIIGRLRAQFELDPLTNYEEGQESQFYTWFELGQDYSNFLSLCQKMLGKADSRRPPQVVSQAQLDPKKLADVVKVVANVDVTPLVRCQSVIGFTEKGRGTLAFQEFFVSIADLQKLTAPDLNFVGSRWLFEHLCQTLDKRMLKAIEGLPTATRPKQISLNLNLSTLLSPEFAAFLDRTQKSFGVVAEVQVVDIFNDLNGYFRARDMLHARGQRILIDGFSTLSLHFVEPGLFGADLLKLIWVPELPDIFASKTGDSAKETIAKVGFERVVLARCDTEASIHWGLSQGINMFQGRFLDTKLAAVTMALCPKSKGCTVAQCTSRRNVVGGPIRAECPSQPNVDTHPDIRSARRG